MQMIMRKIIDNFKVVPSWLDATIDEVEHSSLHTCMETGPSLQASLLSNIKPIMHDIQKEINTYTEDKNVVELGNWIPWLQCTSYVNDGCSVRDLE